MIKILADECIHTDLVLALRQENFDILTVKESGLTGSDDATIYQKAEENGRILLTYDRGFGDIFRFNIFKGSGIIIILISQMSKQEIINITLAYFNLIKSTDIGGKLIIIGKHKIRVKGKWGAIITFGWQVRASH